MKALTKILKRLYVTKVNTTNGFCHGLVSEITNPVFYLHTPTGGVYRLAD